MPTFKSRGRQMIEIDGSHGEGGRIERRYVQCPPSNLEEDK